MTNREEMLKAKEKAAEIRRMIFEQPPEVLSYLGESFTLDDEGHFQHGEIDDCVQEWFDENGYVKPLQKATVFAWMPLPDIKIAVTAKETPEYGEGIGEREWEFSK